MSTYVLIHGAFAGSFWEATADALRRAGHRVFTPELTGCGPRAHLLGPDVDLDTHVHDVLGVLEFEDLRDVVLVAHSYGGVVAAVVADRAADRIARLVYVEALLPGDGQSAADVIPAEATQMFQGEVDGNGDGYRVPVLPVLLGFWSIEKPEHQEAVTARLCEFPWKAFTQPARLPGNPLGSIPGVYVWGARADAASKDFCRPFADRARELGWTVHEVATGHYPQVEDTAGLVALLTASGG